MVHQYTMPHCPAGGHPGRAAGGARTGREAQDGPRRGGEYLTLGLISEVIAAVTRQLPAQGPTITASCRFPDSGRLSYLKCN